ncbi:MAG: RHS repeat domain-containing protein, partial [bacterium]
MSRRLRASGDDRPGHKSHHQQRRAVRRRGQPYFHPERRGRYDLYSVLHIRHGRPAGPCRRKHHLREFLYTADDERIATANGATWTWTVRGLDGKVLREFTSMSDPNNGGLPTANTQWAKDYVWRDGLLLASVTPKPSGGTLTQHFHLDHLGTARLVTADNGVTLGVHAYYPFGAELNLGQNEQPNELMKFTGHERDVLASDPHTLDDMHARYEMGTIGRFLSVDPAQRSMRPAIPQSWNRYTYTINNP